MRPKPLNLTLLSVAIFASGIAHSYEDTYSLKRTPKQNDSLTYSLQMDLVYAGEKTQISQKIDMKVVKVDSKGVFTEEVTEHDGKILVKGIELEMDTPEVRKQQTDERGIVFDLGSKNLKSSDYRAAQIHQFVAPEKPILLGAKWSYEYKANAKRGTENAQIDYQLEGLEKIGTTECAKVKWHFKETQGKKPIDASGYAWIRLSDNVMYKYSAQATNFPMGDGNNIDLSFTYRIVD